MSESTETPTGATYRFPCNACGAELTFHSGQSRLACDHCGHDESIPDSFESVEDHALEGALPAGRDHGWGEARQSLQCEQCGAVTDVAGNTLAAACPFCGGSCVLTTALGQDFLRPEGLVPFKTSKETASAEFRQWLGSLWLRPSGLRKQASLCELAGVYIPFWIFDSFTVSRWRAESGWHYYTRESVETEDGDGTPIRQDKRVLRTRWKPARGAHECLCENEVVSGSHSLRQREAKSLFPYGLRDLVPFQLSFLSGWAAERYDLAPGEVWKKARAAMQQRIRAEVASRIPGDTQRGLDVRTRFLNIRYRHTLLPVWMAAYQYRGQVYRYLVNGQTGKAGGEAPYSRIKVGTLVTALVTLIALGLWWWWKQ